jgi:hypothetical protein
MPDEIKDQILEQLDSLPKGDTPQTVKFGDLEIPMDPVKIREFYEMQQREIEGYKQVNKSLQQRYVQPEQDAQPDVRNQPNVQPAPVNRPRFLDKEDFTKRFIADPQQGVVDALAAHLGLPEGSNVRDAIQQLAQLTVAQQRQLEEMRESQQAAINQMEAQRFLDKTPEYLPSDDNYNTLVKYMNTYQLQPTTQGYEVAHMLATRDNALTVKEKTQAQAVNQTTPLVPSLRGTGTGGPDLGGDLSSYTSRFDKMSTAQVFDFLRSLDSQRR